MVDGKTRRSIIWRSGLAFGLASAAPDEFVIHNTRARSISPGLYGVFFEDINFAADGGLYAELIRNRDFEVLGRGNVGVLGDPRASHAQASLPLYGDMRPWTATGEPGLEVSLTNASHPFAANPTSLHIRAARGGGVSNPGYWGINSRADVANKLSFFAQSDKLAELQVRVVGQRKELLAQATVKVQGAWQEYHDVLTPNASDPGSSFEVRCAGPCDVYLDHVSLFPADAVRGLFRQDLFEMLKGIRPAFVRFPGGNYLEGKELASRWAWKATIGPRQARPGHFNSAWGYWVTDGMGLYEYLVLCEELEAAPQLSVYTGYSMGQKYVPIDKSGAFVQDAVDAVEFANGSPSSAYGKVRADAGHPGTFDLKLFEVGNEEVDLPNYKTHYEVISAAIRKAEPDATIIASGRWGPSMTGHPCLTGDHCDLWDDHYYRPPGDMAKMSHTYDAYDRSLPKVFVGEYAARDDRLPLQGALAEALFMIGFENNADVVKQASFAPLFAHVQGTQWRYDMILFNSSTAFGIPSYYTQQLFAEHRGSDALAKRGGDALLKDSTCSIGPDGTVILKAVSYGGPGGPLRISLPDMKGYSEAEVYKLAGDPLASNTLEEPKRVAPSFQRLQAAVDGSFTVQVEPWSLLVVSMPPQKPSVKYV